MLNLVVLEQLIKFSIPDKSLQDRYIKGISAAIQDLFFNLLSIFLIGSVKDRLALEGFIDLVNKLEEDFDPTDMERTRDWLETNIDLDTDAFMDEYISRVDKMQLDLIKIFSKNITEEQKIELINIIDKQLIELEKNREEVDTMKEALEVLRFNQ